MRNHSVGTPKGRNNVTTLLASLVVGFIGAAAAFNLLGADASGQPERTPAPPAELTPSERTTVELFERTIPSVVNIQTYDRRHHRHGRLLFSEREVEGGGSGFVWDEHGHIVTNFHVIGRYFERRGRGDVTIADNILVSLHDGTTHEATVVGHYVDRDIAVLRIDPERADLVPIKLGTSEGLRVGQDVLAIGNPFGLDSTLTKGIISALDREIRALSGVRIYGAIQTDAAINPGNSGGPLIDSGGRLIGMNTQIKSDTRSSAGIGFAVPSDVIATVVPQLIDKGEVDWPTMGVGLVADAVARRNGIRGGVIVSTVYEGTGADRAGLEGLEQTRRGARIRDIIIAVDGKPVRSVGELRAVLKDYTRGDVVGVTVIRDGEKRDLRVELGAGAID